jgi:hypothetical protein
VSAWSLKPAAAAAAKSSAMMIQVIGWFSSNPAGLGAATTTVQARPAVQ